MEKSKYQSIDRLGRILESVSLSDYNSTAEVSFPIIIYKSNHYMSIKMISELIGFDKNSLGYRIRQLGIEPSLEMNNTKFIQISEILYLVKYLKKSMELRDLKKREKNNKQNHE